MSNSNDYYIIFCSYYLYLNKYYMCGIINKTHDRETEINIFKRVEYEEMKKM